MTGSQLYALYADAYVEASRAPVVSARALEMALERRCGSMTPVERVIAEFAVHDLINGTPMRSRQRFERSLEHGAAVLRHLLGHPPTSQAPNARSTAG